MIFTQGERATPAKRVLDIIRESDGMSPYEVYRHTQLVASTRDAEWFCRELYRVGLVTPSTEGRACWHAVAMDTAECAERLKQVRSPLHKHDDVDAPEENNLLEQNSQ